MKKVQIIKECIFLTLLLIIVLSSLFSLSPIFHYYPHNDSGVFLYVGSQMLQGKQLYSQVWDHKQPLVFLINALGLFINNRSFWGVWVIELIMIILLILMVYLISRRFFNPLVSFLITSSSYLSIFQLFSGNYTEEYAIFFAVVALFCFFSIEQFKKPFWLAVFLGIITGLEFNLKQNYIDIMLTILIIWFLIGLIKKEKSKLQNIFGLLIGFLFINLVSVIYFASQNSLQDYWQASFLYNISYSSVGILERIGSIFDNIEELVKYPLISISFIIWIFEIIAVIYLTVPIIIEKLEKKKGRGFVFTLSSIFFGVFILERLYGKSSGVGFLEVITLALSLVLLLFGGLFSNKSFVMESMKIKSKIGNQWQKFLQEKGDSGLNLLLLGLFDLPLVMMIISISGQNYVHYNIMLFPAVLTLILSGTLFIFYPEVEIGSSKTISALFFAIFIVTIYSPALSISTVLRHMNPETSNNKIVTYITNHSSVDDTVLVWSGGTVINFLTDRAAPTKFSDPHWAYVSNQFMDEIFNTLDKDIQKNPPLFILDTLDENTPFLDDTKCNELSTDNSSGINQKLFEIINFVCSNYNFVQNIEGINIYRYSNSPK